MHADKKGIIRMAIVIVVLIILMLLCVKVIVSTEASGLYSKEEVKMLSKTVWGEAQGLNDYERSMVIWCVLNRFDDGNFGSSLEEIITKPYQFHGYREDFPVQEDIETLVLDVLHRWENGLDGRTLPKEYLYFSGDGKHNYYRTEYEGGVTYDFSLPNPYEEGMTIMPNPENKIEQIQEAAGVLAETMSIYKNALDRTKLDEATKIALLIDFQRNIMGGAFSQGRE